jgi:hypothetical protein
MNLLAIGVLMTAQGPAAPPQDDGGWVLFEAVAAQAGDGVVTLRALDSQVTERLDELVKQGRIRNQEEFKLASLQISQQALQDLVTEELEAQGGQDMGLDREQIEQMISLQIEDERKRIGTTEYIDKLAKEGTDPLADKSERKKSLYRLLWARSKLGMPGPAGTRPTRDRFIRPGELKLIYRSNRGSLKPPRIRLQTIEMPIAAAGSLEGARRILQDALARAEAGEDFGDLVDEYSSAGRSTRGISEWLPLAQLGNTPWGIWAATAQVDDFSSIYQLPPGAPPEVLLLLRMHERDDPAPPKFEDDLVQKNLRRVFSSIRDERILKHEQGILGRQAYTWLNPSLRSMGQTQQLGPRASNAP